jgi:hypothetical protein
MPASPIRWAGGWRRAGSDPHCAGGRLRRRRLPAGLHHRCAELRGIHRRRRHRRGVRPAHRQGPGERAGPAGAGSHHRRVRGGDDRPAAGVRAGRGHAGPADLAPSDRARFHRRCRGQCGVGAADRLADCHLRGLRAVPAHLQAGQQLRGAARRGPDHATRRQPDVLRFPQPAGPRALHPGLRCPRCRGRTVCRAAGPGCPVVGRAAARQAQRRQGGRHRPELPPPDRGLRFRHLPRPRPDKCARGGRGQEP